MLGHLLIEMVMHSGTHFLRIIQAGEVINMNGEFDPMDDGDYAYDTWKDKQLDKRAEEEDDES